MLTTVSLPIPWHSLDFPDPMQLASTAVTEDAVGWAWDAGAPSWSIEACAELQGQPVPGWGLDHVVVLVPDLEEAASDLDLIGLAPRLRMEVSGRPAAFYRVGTVLEVIESPVRAPSLYGLALVTEEPLDVLALRWRSMGRDVSDPQPAIQAGRRILTVTDTEAGLAVMSPHRAVTGKAHTPKIS